MKKKKLFVILFCLVLVTAISFGVYHMVNKGIIFTNDGSLKNEPRKKSKKENKKDADEIKYSASYSNGIKKIEKDLYYLEYTDEYNIHDVDDQLDEIYYNPEYAEYFKKQVGACSGARSGDFVGRNLDWLYIDGPAIVVKTSATKNRLASIAVNSSVIKTKDVENGEITPFMPLVVLDGINEAGVSSQINVVPVGYEVSAKSDDAENQIHMLLVNRYILDNAHSVDEAIELLKNISVYGCYSDTLVEEFHFYISDKTKSVVVEFIDGKMEVTEDNVITNFYQSKKYFNSTIDSLKRLQPMAMGWRRYFMLKDELSKNNIKSVKDMYNVMSKAYYGNAYDINREDFWCDETYGSWDMDGDGVNETTIDINNESETDGCDKYKEYIKTHGHMEEYDNNSWYTEHMTIFDLKNKSLTVIVDEQDFSHAHTFEF